MWWSKKIYPYSKQHVSWRDIWSVIKVLRSPWLTQGPAVKAFEKAIAAYTGATYAVACANGTVALQLAIAALGLPIGFEGITTPNTFVASANSILQNNGKVVFADIEPTTANIDVAQVRAKMSSNTKLIIPVHFAGQPCDMRSLYELARQHGCFIIEDAAHALGSRYQDTVIGSCAFSDITMFSFHPVKTITTGEGAMLTTNNKELYEKLIMLRTIGITRDPAFLTQNDGPWYYQMLYLSTNARLSDIHAALGLSQLKRLDAIVEQRRSIVEYYRQTLTSDRFSLLAERADVQTAWHLCPLLINDQVVKKSKLQLFNELREAGLHLQVHYIPVHTQPYYQRLGYRVGDYPSAERYYQQTISLPLYPGLSRRDLSYIVDTLDRIVR